MQGRTPHLLALVLAAAACTDGDGQGGPSAGREGEGEGERTPFAGATRAVTDGPGEITVFWDPVDSAEVGPYEVFWAAAPASPDTAGAPAATLDSGGLSRATIKDLPADQTVRLAVVFAGEGGDVVVEAATTLPRVVAGEAWRRDLEYGAFSSPGLGDLDGDGVLDVVVGTGAAKVEGRVLALSGATGQTLWTHEVRGEVVGSPAMADVNGDGTLDAVIGGRDVQMWALDGRTGEQIWAFETGAWTASPAVVWHNDVPTFLITVGGLGSREGDPDFDRTNPEHHLDRWSPGRLYAVSGADGGLVGRLTSEEYEYYASPAVADVDGDGAPEVIIGSGGHTRGGEVIVVGMGDYKPIWSQPSGAKGIVSSLCTAELDGDGLPDVIAASEDQHAAAYRGYDGEPLWRIDREGLEYVSSPSAGWGMRRDSPTVMVAGATGSWLDGYHEGVRTVVDGRSGDVLWEHETTGRFLIATPLWADLTGNGLDDVIVAEIEFSPGAGLFFTRIKSLHGGTGEELGVVPFDAAVIPTPTIADLDGDGELDLIWIGMQGPIDQRGALPGAAGRIGLGVPVPEQGISWDRFRGNADNTGALLTPPPD